MKIISISVLDLSVTLAGSDIWGIQGEEPRISKNKIVFDAIDSSFLRDRY